MKTQQAYRLHGYGGPECVRLDRGVPVPTPGPGEVLVAVRAVGMNPFDWKIREGYVKDEMPLPLPIVLGADFVGTVVKLGPNATRLAVGDRVMTISTSLGAYAQYIAVDETILGRVPDALGDVDAATLPMPALTAWISLHTARNVRPGTRVLIHGASGTVGAFAVQLAKAAGAYVIGTASGKNRDYVLGLGADEFVDYTTERFEDRAKDMDLVLDYVLVGGTDDTTARSFGVLAPGGDVVSVTDPSAPAKATPGHRGFFPDVRPDAEVLTQLGEMLATGKLRSKVARVFAFDALLEAMALNQAGGTTGRLIVDVARA